MLNDIISRHIAQSGPISIAQFMAYALSHPEFGYYQTTDPFGGKGDFTTAPEISQVFGELIGIWCAHQWQQMGCPSSVIFVEVGPGRGTLMQDLLRGTRHVPGFHTALNIHMVETSPLLKTMQQSVLTAYPGICWHENLVDVPDGPLLLVANELFDALPIHQYVKTGTGWRERLLGLNKERKLAYHLSPVVPFEEELDLSHPDAPEGSLVEVCPMGLAILHEITRRLKAQHGAALIIDYGYDTPPYSNTLQALKFHKHHPTLADIGDADISAHVDFSALQTYSLKQGVSTSAILPQRNFLLAMGIEHRLQALLKNANESQHQELTTAAHRLIDPQQMGTLFKVLELHA